MIRAVWYLLLAIPDLISVIKHLLKLAREFQEARERKAFLNEVKEAVKESVNSHDNSRLVQLLDPDRSPFTRPSKSGVVDERVRDQGAKPSDPAPKV